MLLISLPFQTRLCLLLPVNFRIKFTAVKWCIGMSTKSIQYSVRQCNTASEPLDSEHTGECREVCSSNLQVTGHVFALLSVVLIRRGSRKKYWGGAGPLNFPSPPLFPTPFPSPPSTPKLSLPSLFPLPLPSLPFPPPFLSFFLIPSFPSLSPFPFPPFP